MKRTVGLYELIGGAKKEELTSRDIQAFLSKNTLDPETRKRLLLWSDELEFWEEQTPDYPLVERAKYHRDLVSVMRTLMEVESGEIWGDFGCGPATMSKVIWEKSKGTAKKIIALDIVLDAAKLRIEEIPVLELKYGNLCEGLDFEDAVFDGIAGNIAIPYVIEFEGFHGKKGMLGLFRELFRVLKPGGQLVWSTPKENFHPEICFISAIPDVMRERKNVPNLFSKLPGYISYGRALRKKQRKELILIFPLKNGMLFFLKRLDS